jgi:alginate O-acetyltransferase complex protein AlgJ
MSNKDFSAADLSAPAPSRYAAVAAVTFSCVMLAGLWQIVAAAWNPGQLDFPRTWLDFREGRSTGTLEKQLDQKLPARTTLIATANSLRYLLTGGGGDQVRVGNSGWLFLTDELRFDTDGNAHLNARAKLFGGAAQGLDRLGVKLVVALVPDKARLYSGKLSSGHYPAYNLSRYEDALAALRKQSVTVVDLLTPLAAAASQGQVYYSSDTHWNQVGAQISADAVALVVRKLGVELEKTTFVSAVAGEKTERPGDLIRLMGLGDTPNALRPPSDTEIAMVTKQTSLEAASGLFGDAAVPVALTGTSYSLRGNFHGFLQQALSAKVLNTAKDGGGLLQATTAYLTDDAFKSAKPKILVWEVPERFLYTKLDDEPKWLKSVGFLP